MTALPVVTDKLVAMIDAATEGHSDHRSHLGASIIGHDCDRYLWLTFRWAISQTFPGRIKRLFRRGKNEEATVIADLRAADLDITECMQHQQLHYIAPHIGCTPDGLAKGHPEAPKTPHSLEIKTHSLKSFNDLEKKGVADSKPMHWAQMQCEMVAQKTERALYVAVCKDNDGIYTERIHRDKDAATAIIERGKRIVFANRMPEPCAGAGPSWYACKMCSGKDMCHGSKMTTEVNCRTCIQSTATEAGTWTCAKYDCEIPIEGQRDGCDAHILHLDLVPWEIDGEASTDDSIVWLVNGKPLANGEADATVFGSREIVANHMLCLDNDEIVKGMREEFGARVSG